ncbi:MAG: branched-chain amino acid transport system II carrier protein [Chlamydiales bacterium]|nr:branched-chain amino acid transport system II carrier protein [Chlamydiales bacterium]
MINHKSASAWVIGLALFSMFFGSGNLIFPIIVGKHAEGMYLIGTMGFVITAVLLPFAGVLTMVIFKGDYTRFFSILGKPLGFLFTFLLLSFWIPLGSGPRCITLAFAAVKTYVPFLPLVVFSAIYSLAVFFMTYTESRVITILGKVLTPLLLLSLAVVVGAGVYFSPGLAQVDHEAIQVFTHALIEGYNTQDLIASFFFSSAVIHILSHAPQEEGVTVRKSHLKLVLQASLIGIGILATVYLGLLYMGATYSAVLQETSKDSLLSQLSLYLLGPHMAFVPVIAIALACVSTSVALALVFTNFIKEVVFRDKISHVWALTMTTVVTFAMSLLGFEGISKVLGAAMQVLYPGLIGLMIVNLAIQCFRSKKNFVEVSQVEQNAA